MNYKIIDLIKRNFLKVLSILIFLVVLSIIAIMFLGASDLNGGRERGTDAFVKV